MLNDKFTIFAAGLFPGKNRVFMEELCKRFRVITIHGFYFEPSKTHKPEIAEELLCKEDLNITETEIIFLMHELLNGLKLDLKDVSPDFASMPIKQDELKTFYPLCKAAISMAFLFKQLVKHIKIDMVVCNADYSGMRRPILIEARRLGIPTLNIEHGYFGMAPLPSALKEPNKHSAWFAISDFVNLDNVLEKIYWEETCKLNNTNTPIKFIINGTPNDNSFDHSLSRKAALQALDLENNKFNIVVAGTWNEAHHPSTIIDGQIAHANYFIDVLTILKEIGRTDFQIILKLHPAFSKKELFTDLTKFMKRFLESINLEVALITNHSLDKIISLSDLLICPHTSSLLWEFFLADVPGVVFPIPSLYELYDLDKLNSSNVLFESQCMRYVFDQAELVRTVNYYSQTKNQKKYKRTATDIKKKYGLQAMSVRKKSDNICNWMSDYLQKNEASQIKKVPLSL